MTDRVRRLGFLKALVRFGQGIEDRQDSGRLLQRAIVLAVRALDVGHGKIMRYRPNRGDLLVVAGVGWTGHRGPRHRQYRQCFTCWPRVADCSAYNRKQPAYR